MMRRVLRLAAAAALVYGIAALGSLNVPGIIIAALALNAICGAALKTEDKHGQIHS